MNSTRQFDNEKIKKRTTYLFWLLLLVAGLIGFQLLNPIIKPHRYSGSTTEWIITFSIISILTIYFIFYKRFVSITFDPLRKQFTLTTTTLVNGIKISDHNYSDITFKNGKDPARFKGKKATEFIEIHIKTKKLIKLERGSIGEYSFDNILKEFQQLNIHN